MKRANVKRLYCGLAGLLFAGMLLSLTACNGKENEEEVAPTTKITNLSTIDQYNQLMEGFRITSDDDTGEPLYDECYGGAYVNDRMELVVLLAENTPENQARVREYTGYEDIIIESCEYSRNELHCVKNRLNLAWDKLRAEGVELGGMGPDEMENRVVVYVYNLEEGETEKLFEAAKSDCLIVHNVIIEDDEACGYE